MHFLILLLNMMICLLTHISVVKYSQNTIVLFCRNRFFNGNTVCRLTISFWLESAQRQLGVFQVFVSEEIHFKYCVVLAVNHTHCLKCRTSAYIGWDRWFWHGCKYWLLCSMYLSFWTTSSAAMWFLYGLTYFVLYSLISICNKE